MKIGLSLAYKGQNYGQQLQAYATQVVLEKMGHSTEIIDYERKGMDGVRFTPWLAAYEMKKIKRKIKGKAGKSGAALDSVHRENIKLRKETAAEFRQKRLHNFVKCSGYQQLLEYGKTIDIALVGSDQCWLPESCFGNLRTLRFALKGVRKVSYATSLGVEKYPLYCRSSAKQFLNRFDYISVREEQGKRIINGLCDKQVEVVLDPTYLLTKEEWEELIPNQREFAEDYLLCFFIGNNEQSKKAAAEYGRKKGLKVISILSDESVSDIDTTFADDIIVGAGPERFVNLIRNASCVMTDSFHGVAFSVINEKQFYVFYRHSTEGKESRNSRIDNVLAAWNLKNRLVSGRPNGQPDDSVIDYKAVRAIIEKRRKESMGYLERALHSE